MSERAFNNFDPRNESVYEIGGGVIGEMAEAFEYELTATPDTDNLGGLIGKIGPKKTLQDNIAHAKAVLGDGQQAVETAVDWVERSGLLLPINGSYMNPEAPPPSKIDTALITGGVRNWMMRRAVRLSHMSDYSIEKTILVGGNRQMKPAEGEDVIEGMTEADYLETIVKPMLEGIGSTALVEVVRVDSGVGDIVMQSATEAVDGETHLVASNAAAWVQNAGQFRRAMQARTVQYDANGTQLYVVSDSFPVARAGEPASTHQNPFSALGQIVRNTQELTRHQ